jgi:hypothetical protein
MNSYQKLKAQIRNLQTKLMIVCNEPNSQNAIYIKAEEKLKYSIEKAIWEGNAIIKNETNKI